MVGGTGVLSSKSGRLCPLTLFLLRPHTPLHSWLVSKHLLTHYINTVYCWICSPIHLTVSSITDHFLLQWWFPPQCFSPSLLPHFLQTTWLGMRHFKCRRMVLSQCIMMNYGQIMPCCCSYTDNSLEEKERKKTTLHYCIRLYALAVCWHKFDQFSLPWTESSLVAH